MGIIDLKVQYNKVIESVLIDYRNNTRLLEGILDNLKDPTFVMVNLVDLYDKLS